MIFFFGIRSVPDRCSFFEMLKPIRLKDHYQRMVRPDLDREDRFYSYRRFTQLGYFNEPEPKHKNIKRLRITAFNGGNVFFRYTDRHDVLEKIAKDAQTGSVMYWNQMAYDVPGEGCRLVADIDSNRTITMEEIIKFAHEFWLTLRAYYPDFDERPIKIFIASCGPRLKKGELSTGIHLIAHVKVTIDQARQLLYGFRLRLQARTDLDLEGVEVDDGIYKPGNPDKNRPGMCSTRMIYSSKVETCPLCLGVEPKIRSCRFCEQSGQVISKSTYRPQGGLDHRTGVFTEQKDSWTQVIRNYSIWPEKGDDRHTYVRPSTDDLVVEEKKSGRSAAAASSPPRKRVKAKVAHRPVSGGRAYELVQELISGLMHGGQQLWNGVEIADIQKGDTGNICFVHVRGLGSSACPYANKDHEGNRVTFSIRKKNGWNSWLTVHCPSDKHGCKEKSKQSPIGFPVPSNIVEELFGEENCNKTSRK